LFILDHILIEKH